MLLQNACGSALQRHGMVPSGVRACHGSLVRLGTEEYALATVEARSTHASAPTKHALIATVAVTSRTAAMEDCSRAAAERVWIVTAVSRHGA